MVLPIAGGSKVDYVAAIATILPSFCCKETNFDISLELEFPLAASLSTLSILYPSKDFACMRVLC